MRLNNHRKDFNNANAIPACHYFKTYGHDFMKHMKVPLIEQLSKTSNISKDTLKLRF